MIRWKENENGLKGWGEKTTNEQQQALFIPFGIKPIYIFISFTTEGIDNNNNNNNNK